MRSIDAASVDKIVDEHALAVSDPPVDLDPRQFAVQALLATVQVPSASASARIEAFYRT
jgi:hypothetical protein